MLSHVTGLASKDQLRALSHVLRQVETGIYESARLWGDGVRSLTAAFKVTQHRMHNIFDILRTYRTSLHTIQFDFLQARLQTRQMLRWQNIVVAKALHFLANTSVQLTEIEALYQGIQSLMAGDISHFILPHETLAVALDHIQHHLDTTQPHVTLCHRDLTFYYIKAEFKTFRKDSTLFLVMDVPITSDNLHTIFSCMMLLSYL